jgi:uncharacterized membrane protein YwzB
MKKNKFNLKAALLFLAVAVAIIATVSFGLKGSNHFNVIHNGLVLQTVGADGRSPVGGAESYTIQPSSATVLKMIKKNNAVWIALAWVFVLIAAGWVFIVTNDIVVFGENSTGANNVFGILLLAAMACFLAAYSSGLVSNDKTITPQEYEQIKGDNDKLQELFLDKEYNR